MRTNITTHRGERYRLPITWLDSQDAPVNLAGVAGTFQVRKEPRGPILATGTVKITDEANGVMEATLTSAQTDALSTGRYVYSVDVDEGNSLVLRLLSGFLDVRDDGDAVDCPEAVTVSCDAQGYTTITVATVANDFGITASTPFLIAAATGSTVPTIVSEPEPGGATVSLVSREDALNSDGTTTEVAIYEIDGPDGTYGLRGV